MNDQQAIFDALTTHNVYLQRLSTQAVNEILKQFNGLSNEQINKLAELLGELSQAELTALAGGQYTTDALKEVRTLMNAWYSSIVTVLPETFAVSTTALAVYEATYTAKLLNEKIKEPNGKTLFNKARKTPFAGGMLVDDLFTKIAGDLRQRVEYTIRDSINSGETTQKIVQRIKGTKKLNYQDGILNKSRHEINTLVRTARSHVQGTAMESVYQELGFEWLKVLATLDGRTCKFCASQDGKIYRRDDPKRPPFPSAHPNNRTIYVPVRKDGELIGKRPFVADDRPVKKIPKDQREGKIEQVNANTNYADWFERQTAEFKEQYLGKTKYKLYRDGKYPISRFVDETGQELTIAELRLLDAKTFKELGL